ncbi:MAG: STN domain-containing protein [Pirellulales bacterium]|nr:STN domain-containing protein [Pirellulales bacterium]
MSLWIIRVALIGAIAIGTSEASKEGSTEWREGDAFYEQLATPIGATWSGTRLADVATGLSRSYNVAIVLDRRVDPEQAVSFSVAERPLIDVLVELARRRDLGIYLLGSVACLCPPDTAERVEMAGRARRAEVLRLQSSARQRWSAKESMSWDELSTPRELLSQLAKQGRFEITNLERLPHDLWAAGHLPKLSLADRVSFVLGQFGLTYEISGDSKKIRLVAIPEASASERTRKAGDTAKHHVEQWKTAAKRAMRTKRSAQAKKSRTSGGKKEVRIEKFTAREVEIEPLLRQLTSRLELTLELDRKAIDLAGISLERRVTVSLQQVTPEEMFEEILAPLGLKATFSGKTVRISTLVKK